MESLELLCPFCSWAVMQPKSRRGQSKEDLRRLDSLYVMMMSYCLSQTVSKLLFAVKYILTDTLLQHLVPRRISCLRLSDLHRARTGLSLCSYSLCLATVGL